MTSLTRIFARWRAWRHALRFIATYATRMSVRHEIVIVLRISDADNLELADIKSALPGWHVAWASEDEVRCVPPAVAPLRRRAA